MQNYCIVQFLGGLKSLRRTLKEISLARHILPLISISLELCNQLFNLRIEALFQSLLDRKSVV